MRKKLKKLAGILMILALVLSMTPVSVSAVSTQKTQIIYLPADSDSGYSYVIANNLDPSEKIIKSSVKSSNKEVLTIQDVSLDKTSSLTEYFNGNKDFSYSTITGYIGVVVHKPGTCNVSYKIGKTTYKTTVTVKPYTNPLKTVTISGINSGKNIASSANKTINPQVKLTATKKNSSVKVVTKSGWNLVSVSLQNQTNDNQFSFRNLKKNVSSVTLPLGTLTKNKPYVVSISVAPSGGGVTFTIHYLINTNTP